MNTALGVTGYPVIQLMTLCDSIFKIPAGKEIQDPCGKKKFTLFLGRSAQTQCPREATACAIV